jgi:hypothetical protein
MSRWAWGSALALLGLLVAVGALMQDPSLELTGTTFGTVPKGYGAVYDLLSELGFPVSRSYESAALLPHDATVWWIEPAGLCTSSELETAGEGVVSFVQAGGTAVVFLSPAGAGRACEALGGIAVPAREPVTPPEDADSDAVREDGDGQMGVRQRVAGALVPRTRELVLPHVSAFVDAGDWQVAATVDGRPLVLERAAGHGRLALVADARILRNAWLGNGAAAPFAVDLVRGFGVPRFDERAHGLRVEAGAWRYLLTSPAAFVFVGLGLLGALCAWRGVAWPARRPDDAAGAAPTLETFVDSLAALYARSGDYDRVLQRYRELSLARLRRHFGLPPETPDAVVATRLQSSRRVGPEGLRWFGKMPQVTTERALRDAARMLDELTREAMR